jgi:hypothetical protein
VKNTLEKIKSGKSSPKIPNPTTNTPSPQITQSPIEEISDLLDILPINACVELPLLLLRAAPTLSSGATPSRAVLKIFDLFVPEYGSTA